MQFEGFDQFYRKAVNIKISVLIKETLLVKGFHSKKDPGFEYFIYRSINM
jgi:hypothetical protein